MSVSYAHGQSISVVVKDLDERLERIENILEQEEQLRAQHPALKDAWDKYLSVKKLVTK